VSPAEERDEGLEDLLEHLRRSRGFDFSAEDRVPTELYNKILWEGLKGTPAPAVSSTQSDGDGD